MDVLTAAWTAAGRPLPAVPAGAGRCARCSTSSTGLTPVRQVLSTSFTGYDTWDDPGRGGLCPACTWGHTTPALRATAHHLTRTGPRLRPLSRPALAARLGAPLSCDEALVVPLRPGRKHLLPDATWGRITLDDLTLPWTPQDVIRLQAVRRLRQAGFGSRMLTAPAPAWTVVHRLPAARRTAVMDDWSRLQVWRDRPPLLAFALHATVPAARPSQAVAA